MKILKAILLATGLMVGINVSAGGISETPQSDATVTCAGANGEVTFNVMKSQYKGEVISISDRNSAVVRIMDPKVLRILKEQNLIRAVEWNQRAFLKSLNVDIESYREHVSMFIDTRLWNPGEFLAHTLMGGTLDEYYRSVLPQHRFTTEVEDVDDRQSRQEYLEMKIFELSSSQYKVVFSKLISGQKKCIKTKMVPHPWAGAGSLPKDALMEVCEQYKKVDNQTREHVTETLITINQCKLNTFK